ncbi:MAG: 4Fe-4S dicluster domain-containing protein [Clostridia bacterium]|nr:4Fe-4S dicluster domain-containing protein [Clostridia bacterium]
MKQICDKNKCTGCSSCLNICPKNCITMKEDEYGILMPNINEEECIDCKACKRICPENNNIEFKNPIKVYAAWSLNDSTRKKSASGGIAYEMYKHIIKNNGVAVGTEFDENLNLVHKIATSMEEVDKFRGSKYVQSSIGTTFEQTKRFLKEGKRIIFIGTPCQINGLQNFMKNEDMDNIITVDLICHGVPPIKYLKEYLEYINLNNKIDNITFRGENNEYITAYKNEKIVYKKNKKEDFYYKSFYNGLFNRENCYQCRYARKERVGDITIGDFWGLGKKNPFNYDITDGVSLVLINSEKGYKFISEINAKIFLQERTIEEALQGNKQLNHPIVKNKKTDEFKELYKKLGFKEAITHI